MDYSTPASSIFPRGGWQRVGKTIHTKEYEVFLRHLRQARKDAGLTQTDLARRIGQTQSFVSKCERGKVQRTEMPQLL